MRVGNKKVFALMGIMLCFVVTVFAHTPLLTVEDNGDGTIFVQGGFSNGSSAGGVKVYLLSAATGNKLWESTFPDIGELDITIPNEPYIVVFDAGPGHIVKKEGPPPPGGFGAAPSAGEGKKEETSAAPSASSGAGNTSAPQMNWTAQDTASVMPSAGISYLSIFIAALVCANFIMLLLLLRRKH